MIEDLYCRRTIAECMRGGVMWIVSHFGTVMRRLWLPALIVSLLTPLMSTLASIANTMRLEGEYYIFVMLMMVEVVVVLLFFFATVYLNSAMYRIVCGISWGQAMRRCSVVLLLVCAVSMVCWIATVIVEELAYGLGRIGGLPDTIGIAILLIVGIALIVGILVYCSPLVYLFTKYIVDREETVGSVWRHYRFSLRYVGYLIAYIILIAIVIGIVAVVINMPQWIINTAMVQSARGVAYGDPVGLPGSVYPLSLFIGMVTTFVMALPELWAMISTLYIYGCMESRRGRTVETEADETTVEG